MAAYSANDTGILLESGTNELELLEFNVCGNSYGINIAKVREIMMEQERKLNHKTNQQMYRQAYMEEQFIQ